MERIPPIPPSPEYEALSSNAHTKKDSDFLKGTVGSESRARRECHLQFYLISAGNVLFPRF